MLESGRWDVRIYWSPAGGKCHVGNRSGRQTRRLRCTRLGATSHVEGSGIKVEGGSCLQDLSPFCESQSGATLIAFLCVSSRRDVIWRADADSTITSSLTWGLGSWGPGDLPQPAQDHPTVSGRSGTTAHTRGKSGAICIAPFPSEHHTASLLSVSRGCRKTLLKQHDNRSFFWENPSPLLITVTINPSVEGLLDARTVLDALSSLVSLNPGRKPVGEALLSLFCRQENWASQTCLWLTWLNSSLGNPGSHWKLLLS